MSWDRVTSYARKAWPSPKPARIAGLLVADFAEQAPPAPSATASTTRACLRDHGSQVSSAARESAGVVAGVLVVAGGQPTPLFELTEAAFDGVPAGVAVRVEARWSAAGRAAPAVVAGLVVLLRDGVADAAVAQQPPIGPGAVALVREQIVRASTRSSWNQRRSWGDP
jgi:hypothetical protein